MPAGLVPICFTCARFNGVKAGKGYTCEAFLNSSIPTDILASVVDHHNPYKGDHGLQYSAKKAVDTMPKIASDPPVSEAQRRAMWAAASGESNIGIPESVGKEFANADPGGKLPAEAKDMDRQDWRGLIKGLFKFLSEEAQEPEHNEEKNEVEEDEEPKSFGAGVAFVTPTGHALFVKRSGLGDHEGEWCFPGGSIEEGETPEECARREAKEEIGDCTFDDNFEEMANSAGYHTFRQSVDRRFKPRLNEESTDCFWAPLTNPPQPLHPGVETVLNGISEDEDDAFDAWDAWSPEARKAAAESRHIHMSATHESSGKPSFTAKASNNAEVEKHLNALHEHIKKNNLGNHNVSIHHTNTGIIHNAKVGGSSISKSYDESEEEKEHNEGELTETTREKIGTSGSSKREDMPEEVFLGPNRTYPVKEKRDGGWKYTRNLLLAAARRARMEHQESIAKKADAIRAREFGEKTEDESFEKVEHSLAHKKGVHDPKALAAWIGREHGKIPADQASDSIALDRGSSRSYDSDGRLHVDSSNISKATVNPYFGREIPDYEALGLDPDKKYMLLRHPDELKKAVDTFNGLPILSKHIPVSAEKPSMGLAIGSTGTHSKFEPPYLKNDLVFWPKDAIDRIEDGVTKQLSCAYRYKADMSPGEYEGTPYDGVMRDIVGNHVALVKEGRAGPDVVVGDSKEELFMANVLKLARRPTVMAALRAFELDLRRKGSSLALDASEFVKELEKNEKEGEDNLESNAGVPITEKENNENGGSPGEDSYDDEDDEEEEREEKEAADRRADDARKHLGRDETEEEKEERERMHRAEDARKHLGRDETEAECKEREDREADDKHARDTVRAARDMYKHAKDAMRHARDRRSAMDARHRLGRDESEEEMKERVEEDRKARDSRRTARAGMDKRRADDKHVDADDKHRADDRKRADDRRAKDEPPPFKGKPEIKKEPNLVTREAMDAAIKNASKEAMVNQQKIRDAERHVRSWVGDLALAFDSADDVYRTALTMLGEKVDSIHPSAYPAILQHLPKPGAKKIGLGASMAADSATQKSFYDLIPSAARLKN